MFTLWQNLLESMYLRESINFHNCLSQIENPHDLLSFEGRVFFFFSISFLQLGPVKLLYFTSLAHHSFWQSSIQFSSVAQPCLTLSDLMDCSTPGFPGHHQLPELTQTHVHSISDVIQQSHPLLSLSPPAFNLSQHQGLSQWVSSLHQVAKVLEFQLQHQSFQWISRIDFF